MTAGAAIFLCPSRHPPTILAPDVSPFEWRAAAGDAMAALSRP
jgi:hypothetical protein